MRRRKYSGECPLCGAAGRLTKEDVVPIWYREELQRRHIAEGALPARVRMLVCGKCNGDLSRAFENVAAPVMKRAIWSQTPHPLTAAESLSVLRWLIKTDVLLAIWRGYQNDPRLFTLDDRRTATLIVLVWVMLDHSTVIPDRAYVRVGLVSAAARPQPRPFNTWAAWRAAGDSGWITSIAGWGQMVSQTAIKLGAEGDIPSYARALAFDPRFVQLAPSGGRVVIPSALAPTDVGRMRREFAHRQQNIVNNEWRIRLDGK